jgi:hypothetical protein
MKRSELLEYRIKRLERMIGNHRAVKNESLSIGRGRKMFAYDTSLNQRQGMYVITDDKWTLKTFIYELPTLWKEDGLSGRSAVRKIFRNGNVTVIDKPCDTIDRPTVVPYGDFLDNHPYYDDSDFPRLGFEDLIFVDKNNQIHELEFLKYEYPPKYIHG